MVIPLISGPNFFMYRSFAWPSFSVERVEDLSPRIKSFIHTLPNNLKELSSSETPEKSNEPQTSNESSHFCRRFAPASSLLITEVISAFVRDLMRTSSDPATKNSLYVRVHTLICNPPRPCMLGSGVSGERRAFLHKEVLVLKIVLNRKHDELTVGGRAFAFCSWEHLQ